LRLLVPSSKITRGKLFAIGVATDFRGCGIAEALNDCAFSEMRRRGYVHAEIGWIDEDNPISHQIISTLDAPLSAVHRIYEVDLP
jgi:L-amino acid N-acyltransferase YncA